MMNSLVTFIAALAALLQNAAAVGLGEDGSCSLLNFFAFTDAETINSKKFISQYAVLNSTSFQTKIDTARMGFDFMASALLAMDHFNSRDKSVVAAVTKGTEKCSVFFPNATFVDSGRDDQYAFKQMLGERPSEPCAILGPFFEEAIESTLMLATTFHVPQLLYSVTDYRLTLPRTGPNAVANSYSHQVLARDIVSFLQRPGMERDYLAVVHFNSDKRSRLAQQIQTAGDQVPRRLNVTTFELGPVPPPANKTAHYTETWKRVFATGYRTIFLLYHRSAHLVDFAEILDQRKMLNGDFVFLLMKEAVPPHEVDSVYKYVKPGSVLDKLLQGSIVLSELDGFQWNEDDAFLREWRSQNNSFVGRVNSMTPLKPNRPEYFQGRADYFATHNPYPGASFVYDSVMAIGLGACALQTSSDPKTDKQGRRLQPPEPGELPYGPFVKAIQSQKFRGASGNVSFHFVDKIRTPEGIVVGAFNIRRNPESNEYRAILSALRTGDEWHDLQPFVYSNGLTAPPAVKLAIEDENFLSPWVRILGLSLFGVAWFVGLTCALGVYLTREDSIMKAGQPVFLELFCLGSIITSTAILTLSFDEGSGWSSQSLSVACMSTPWLFFVGLVTVYAALFCKMWRVDRVLQMSRRRVKVVHVLSPLIILLIVTITLLTVWTIVDPWTWGREMIGINPPETYGKCKSDSFAAYFFSLVAVTMFATTLAVVWAWKTMDVPSALSDTRAVFYAVATHLQAWFIGLPVLAALDEDSANATYLGRVLLIWVFGFSTNVFLICPKLYAIWQKRRRGGQDGHHRQQSRVHITGLSGSDQSGISDAQLGTLRALSNGKMSDEGTVKFTDDASDIKRNIRQEDIEFARTEGSD